MPRAGSGTGALPRPVLEPPVLDPALLHPGFCIQGMKLLNAGLTARPTRHVLSDSGVPAAPSPPGRPCSQFVGQCSPSLGTLVHVESLLWECCEVRNWRT